MKAASCVRPVRAAGRKSLQLSRRQELAGATGLGVGPQAIEKSLLAAGRALNNA